MSLGDRQYIDGGLGYNNPVLEYVIPSLTMAVHLLKDVSELWLNRVFSLVVPAASTLS
jgi:hypothetical protein